ncbi:hypothetical protein KO465_05390 [Candidatus Micrarchaeota archaeon]|nr:hypothetical protein [Candidatus Micrarchaeota archaeon]
MITLPELLSLIDINVISTNLLQGAIAAAVFLLISIVGFILAKLMGWLWKQASDKMKLEIFLKNHGLHDALLGWTLTGVIKFLLEIWIFFIFLGIAADIAEFGFLTIMISGIVAYLPGLVEGIAIIVVALMFGDYITNQIKDSKTPFAKPIGLILEIAIAYIGVVMALPLVLPGANINLLENTFMTAINALFFTVAIALGLGGAIAIGLGSKDIVKDIVKKKQKEIEKII